MDPNNFQPVSNITAEELPDGFQLVNPAAGTTSNEPASSSSSQQEQKMAILEQAMTSEALARLNRIRMVNSKKATQVENVVVQMAMSGKLPGPINVRREHIYYKSPVGLIPQNFRSFD